MHPLKCWSAYSAVVNVTGHFCPTVSIPSSLMVSRNVVVNAVNISDRQCVRAWCRRIDHSLLKALERSSYVSVRPLAANSILAMSRAFMPSRFLAPEGNPRGAVGILIAGEELGHCLNRCCCCWRHTRPSALLPVGFAWRGICVSGRGLACCVCLIYFSLNADRHP